jgi:fructose-specific phosphotransferase system IIA component
MKLYEIIDQTTIKVPLKAGDKYQAIEELVELLHQAGKISETSSLLKAILDREKLRTTGVGQGLAIPHGKCENLTDLVIAVGKPSSPIDFESIDGKPVNLIFLMGSPVEQSGPHIQSLAKIGRLMTISGFRKKIQKANLPDQIFQAFVDHEEE